MSTLLAAIITLFNVVWGTNHTTFYYEVASVNPPAISHIVFETCVAPLEVGVFNPNTNEHTPVPFEFGYDPTTQVTGVKIDLEVPQDETVIYYLKFFGLWEMSTVNIAVKRGTLIEMYSVAGPGLNDPLCTPTAVQLSVAPHQTSRSTVTIIGLFLSCLAFISLFVTITLIRIKLHNKYNIDV